MVLDSSIFIYVLQGGLDLGIDIDMDVNTLSNSTEKLLAFLASFLGPFDKVSTLDSLVVREQSMG